MKRFLFYWLPLYLYTCLIYYQSSRPFYGIGGISVSTFFLHVIEYLVLAVLVYRVFSTSDKVEFKTNALLFTIIFATLYGVSDEIHQLFVSGRVGSLTDIFADFLGSCLVSIKHILNN